VYAGALFLLGRGVAALFGRVVLAVSGGFLAGFFLGGRSGFGICFWLLIVGLRLRAARRHTQRAGRCAPEATTHSRASSTGSAQSCSQQVAFTGHHRRDHSSWRNQHYVARAQKTRLTAPEQSNLATDSDTATSSSGGRARAAGYIAEIAIAQSRIGEAAPMQDW